MIGNKQRSLREKSRKKSPEKKSGSVMLSALKNFGVIFAVCLVVFGLIASFTVTFITSAVDDIFSGEQDELESILSSQNNQGQTKDDDDFVVPSGESFSALFVVTDYDPGYFTYYPEGEELEKLKAEGSSREMGVLGAGYRTVSAKYIVIVRADKASREYTVTPLASCTRVFTSAGYKLLGDLYYCFGEQYFVEKVSALTGISIDYYYFMNVTEAPEIIKRVGEFTVDLATDIYSNGAVYGTASGLRGDVTTVLPPETEKNDSETSKSGSDKTSDTTESESVEEPEETDENDRKTRTNYDVAVRAGTVTVNDTNITALLLFENYENGVEERCDLEFQIAKGFLARLASLTSSELDSVFSESCIYTDYDEFSRELYDDGKINTNMDVPVFAKKKELLAAFLRFTVTDLEFPGKYTGEYFAPSLTDGTTMFYKYKLPADPDKE